MTGDRDADQAAAIDKLRQSLASGKRRPVLQAATGFGKTKIAMKIIERALGKGRRATFVVPSLNLVDQAVEDFWAEGLRDFGVIQADHQMTDWAKPVQIASIQTLDRRGFPECGLVIRDECHKLFEADRRWMSDPDWRTVPFIGLSATPWAKGLGKYFDDLIIGCTIGEGIAKGYLSPFRVFAPSKWDVSQVSERGGDYVEKELAEAVNKNELVGDVVSTWLRLGEDRPTFVFGVDRAHALHLSERFRAAGIASAYQDAETSSTDRKAMKRAFHDGEIRVVCSVGTLIVGVDWDIRCISMARHTKSEMLMVQAIGRGLRIAEGKRDLLVIDHTDNHHRLGFVTDIGRDRLDDGTVRRAAPRETPEKLPKECPACSFLKDAGVRECMNCGFIPEPTIKPRDVETRDGVLEELTKRGGTCKVSSRVIQLRAREIPLTVFMGALKQHAKEKGYKPGWASHKYFMAVGEWPPRAVKDAPECMIPDEVASWIKAQLIRWAKSKRRQQSHDNHQSA